MNSAGLTTFYRQTYILQLHRTSSVVTHISPCTYVYNIIIINYSLCIALRLSAAVGTVCIYNKYYYIMQNDRRSTALVFNPPYKIPIRVNCNLNTNKSTIIRELNISRRACTYIYMYIYIHDSRMAINHYECILCVCVCVCEYFINRSKFEWILV